MNFRGISIALVISIAGCGVPASQPLAPTPTTVLPSSSGDPGRAVLAGKGYRQDKQGLVVVHLRGTEAELEEQYRFLLADEIAAFDARVRRHRGMQSYLGGCSNIAVFGPASADGSLWHGRNFDFSGHGLLDRYRVVYIVEPDAKIPYVTLSWTGPIPWNYRGVHTAMNSSGLTLGYMISQAPGESNRGTPALWGLFREVIERATTIDEAVAILEASPRGAAANLLLADGKTPDAVVVEMTSKALVVRPAKQGVVYSTNHFVSPELFYAANRDPDSIARFERLGALAEDGYGAFDLAHTVSALRDRYDVHLQQETPEGDVIGNPLNMLSVVFHPADLTFWVAEGSAPSSYRQFVSFNLQAELDGTQWEAEFSPVRPDATLDAGQWEEIEAYQSGRRAYDQGDYASAVEYFSRAVELNPDSPRYGYRLAGALMNLKRYDEAIAALQGALTGDSESVYRTFIYHRLGLIYEGMGDREQMREAFEQVLAIDVGDEAIESYARQALSR